MFSVSDRVSAQRHLNLPPSEIGEGSILYQRMTALEQMDATYGSDLVDAIQFVLLQLDTLENEIDSARATSDQGVKSYRVDGQYSVDYGNNADGGLTGKINQYNKYLADLQRDLGFTPSSYPDDQVGVLVV